MVILKQRSFALNRQKSCSFGYIALDFVVHQHIPLLHSPVSTLDITLCCFYTSIALKLIISISYF